MSGSTASPNPNNSVAYSRMGDEFHYRWAARRCLRLLFPNSPLQHIFIEGSDPDEGKTEGELVIDVAEYSRSAERDVLDVVYYQLKHTYVRYDSPFTLSDLENTLTGFAERYQEHLREVDAGGTLKGVAFKVLTNRPISQTVKGRIAQIAQGETITIAAKPSQTHQFQLTLERYTSLHDRHLHDFCARLIFEDREGDYAVQERELRHELTQILADPVDSKEVSNLVELVRKRVLLVEPEKIEREDVLKQLGFSARDLFPAPPAFEALGSPIIRRQQTELLETILNASDPVVLHAEGGMGKSIVAQQLAQALPDGSLGIVYDCFGGGKYRKISERRHLYRVSLVQMANELAVQGLCSPLLSQNDAPDRLIYKFFTCLTEVIDRLRKVNQHAHLVIFIDAADNAAMAADENNDKCFVHGLVRADFPEGCKFVLLCRPERRDLLRLPSNVVQVALAPFSLAETATHLRQTYSDATGDYIQEFHRLTSGNPRVQAYMLARPFDNIEQLLAALTETGSTIEAQIESQLAAAISAIQDNLPDTHRESIKAICTGLASLPPFIPIAVLASAAHVNPSTVRSLAADLGHSFWMSEQAIHFRDEPTETWFRKKFAATQLQAAEYVQRLTPLASDSAYVAEALPGLLHHAGQYDRLVQLALDDTHLPKNSPIDERQIRVYRLQFAFKAYNDPQKLDHRLRYNTQCLWRFRSDKTTTTV